MYRKILVLSVLLLSILSTQSSAGQVNSFIYHRFDESRYPSTNISAEIFTQQLEFLKQQKIEIISLREVVKRLVAGTELPEYAVSICVDDAFRSFYDVGMPIIRKYDIPVTLFVNTASVGASGYLTWDEIIELAAEGVEIENHTDTHPYMVELQTDESYSEWRNRIKLDVLKSQQKLEKHLGFRPSIFVYPFGEYSADIVQIIKEIGFEGAFAQQSGIITANNNRYILPRFPMGGPFATLAGFKSKLKMKALPVIEASPFDPVIKLNPPVLSLNIAGRKINTNRFNCFVQGDNNCRVELDKEKGAGWYKVIAEKPLSGRRNKYTLTLQNSQGEWLWYSHLWINAKNPAIKE